MAITISGVNNNDRIVAADGTIDALSGFNVVGVMTATSFSGDLVGNVTGNVTGNINNSTLLLQTGGYERFRITGNNELGIAGANYGSSGQVLTSGGSGSAVSWTTPAVTGFTNGSNNRIITATGANTLLGEQNLTFDSSTLAVTGNITATGNFVANGTMNVGSYAVFGAVVGSDPGSNYYGTTNRFGGGVSISGALNIDGDIGHIGDTNTKIRFPAADTFSVETNAAERLRITSAGFVQIGAAANAAEAPLHVTAENSNGINAIFGAKDFVTVNTYNYDDANIALQGRDADDNDTGAGIQFTVRNTGNTNWLHGAITMDQSGNYIFKNGGAGTTVGTEKLRIESDGQVVINRPSGAVLANSSTKLEVYNATENVIFVANSTAAANQDAGIIFAPANNVYGGKIIVTSDEDFSTSANRSAHMAFYTRKDGTAAERLRINSAGQVTKPAHPSFLAGRTGGNQTFTVGTFPLNVARLNVGNHYDTSTYKFTAPVAGVYYFFAQVYYNNGNGAYRLGFRKTPSGGSALMLNTASHELVGNDDHIPISIVESMGVGDTVELYSDQNASIQCYYNINDNTFGAHTYFGGYLIG